ncbi:Carbohydrate-binding module family 13 protein [Mycena sanguinolenta]|uniref:Carbohydrate-binding module family 13 protein n=1 Tax=Mycena sanguinolenta TaxID=230812 RepID=A0A8H6Y3Q0_9AGAR|nr:Carbohydrate-binding module family 13 protein [Mycena sanguinolenta]
MFRHPIFSSLLAASVAWGRSGLVRFSSATTSDPTTTTSGTIAFIHPTANAAKCLSAASNADGAAVEIEDCVSGSTSQGWTTSGSNLQIFGDKCLDVTNGMTTDGTLLQIWTCATGDTNQMWTISGSTIQWTGHSSCLDLTNGVTTDGNIVYKSGPVPAELTNSGPRRRYNHAILQPDLDNKFSFDFLLHL